MSAKLGKDAKLFYKTGGVAAEGDWTELTCLKDVTLNVEKSEADVTTRANNGWKAVLGALKEGSVELEIVWDPEDAGFTAVQESFFQDKALGLAILDGPMESGTGLKADFAVTKFSRKEPLGEAMTAGVTAKPTYSATPPVWMEEGKDSGEEEEGGEPPQG
jgi:hypothetical protein